jgi:glycosyltransferase involved in cell wall biosynthesis
MNAALFSRPKMSVIVPTRDRPEKLGATLAALGRQQDMDPTAYELIVVDDGSVPPAIAETPADGPEARVIRLEGDGPSAARNRGATAARGELLVFVDDDMEVAPSFLASHLQAHVEWPGMLQVGFNRLSEEETATPFGRFRQRLEDQSMPSLPGRVEAPNFCTAANMAIESSLFGRLGGFDSKLSTGEDQDLAMRHTEAGGGIVFVPAAHAVHNDSAVGLTGYCARAERYMEELVRFGARHPDWPDSVERARVNGPIRWAREPPGLSAKKLLKTVLLWRPVHVTMLRLVSLVEAIAPESRLLDKLYRVLLGAHLQRGYRRGVRSADE